MTVLADLDFINGVYVVNGEVVVAESLFTENADAWGEPGASYDARGLFGMPLAVGDLLQIMLAGCTFVIDLSFVGVEREAFIMSYYSDLPLGLDNDNLDLGDTGGTISDDEEINQIGIGGKVVPLTRLAYLHTASQQYVSKNGDGTVGFAPSIPSVSYNIVVLSIDNGCRVEKMKLLSPVSVSQLQELSSL